MNSFRLGTLAAFCVLAGCSNVTPRVSNVFDDLVNESTTSSASTLFSIKSFLSISGVGPGRSVGSYAYQPDGASPTHSVGISPKWSHIVRRRYPASDADLETLKGLGLQYQLVLSKAAAYSELTVQVLAAETAARDAGKYPLACALLSIASADCNKERIDSELVKLRSKEAAAESAFRSEKDKFGKQATIRNAVVMRWEKRADAGGDAGYGGLASAKAASMTGNSGLAVYGDIMIDTLYVGEDFLDLIREYNKADLFGFSRVSIATYVVSARFVEYVSDASIRDELAMKAKFSQKELDTLLSALGEGKDVTEATLALTYVRMKDVGNRGILHAPETEEFDFCFMPAALHEVRARALLPDTHSPVYVVQAQLSTLATYATSMSKPRTDWALAENNAEDRRRQFNDFERRCGVGDGDPVRRAAKTWRETDKESFMRRVDIPR